MVYSWLCKLQHGFGLSRSITYRYFVEFTSVAFHSRFMPFGRNQCRSVGGPWLYSILVLIHQYQWMILIWYESIPIPEMIFYLLPTYIKKGKVSLAVVITVLSDRFYKTRFYQWCVFSQWCYSLTFDSQIYQGWVPLVTCYGMLKAAPYAVWGSSFHAFYAMYERKLVYLPRNSCMCSHTIILLHFTQMVWGKKCINNIKANSVNPWNTASWQFFEACPLHYSKGSIFMSSNFHQSLWDF